MKDFVIGICGHKHAGKDTVASMINYIFGTGVTRAKFAEWYVYKLVFDKQYKDRIIHFADPLKDIVSIMFNIERELFDDPTYKDNLWYNFELGKFVTDEYISKLTVPFECITIDMLQKESLKNIFDKNTDLMNCIKLRTLMQYIGTDIVRNNINDKIWINLAKTKAFDKARERHICIIPDVRFENEANVVRVKGKYLYGVLIKVNRKTDETDNHISELLITNTDYTIDNYENITSLFYKVLEIVQKLVNL